MFGVQPEFDLVANIVVSFVRGDFLAVFQGLNELASNVGEVRKQEGKVENKT